MNKKRSIGLTGGISTGKSTVSDYLANRYKLDILDADVYAKEAVEFGSPILEEIVKRYGEEILLSDSSLDRQRLGNIIFQNPEEKSWLEKQIHPFVRDRFECNIKKLDAKTIILAIPLLFEAKMTDLVNEIWVVYCNKDLQLERLQKRDRLTKRQAFMRIASQLPIEQKVAAADVVLDNSSTLEVLYEQIDRAIVNCS
jgi:dephospho-CoA kinase